MWFKIAKIACTTLPQRSSLVIENPDAEATYHKGPGFTWSMENVINKEVLLKKNSELPDCDRMPCCMYIQQQLQGLIGINLIFCRVKVKYHFLIKR
jgi:hypothetical protein